MAHWLAPQMAEEAALVEWAARVETWAEKCSQQMQEEDLSFWGLLIKIKTHE